MVLLLLVSPGPPNRIGVEHAALVTMFSSLRGRPPASGYGMRTAMLRCWLVLETLQSRCSPQFWHTHPAPLTPPPQPFPHPLPLFPGGGWGQSDEEEDANPGWHSSTRRVPAAEGTSESGAAAGAKRTTRLQSLSPGVPHYRHPTSDEVRWP